jgi:hypothetical protein
MNKIPNGGFPPLVKNKNKTKKTNEKITLKTERFYTNDKKININQILNNNIKKIITIDNNIIDEINIL